MDRVSLGAERVFDEVQRIWRRRAGTVRVLDVACGSGDALVRVARRARKRGVDVALTGCDISAVALDVAQRRAEGLEEIDFLKADALFGELPEGYDLVCSSLFLHHLSGPQAIGVLRRMARATRDTVLVQDLRRTRLGYVFAFVGLHLLTRSDVARTDGLVSVRASFTLGEARELCASADLRGFEVAAAWPQRFTIRWTRP